MMSLGKKQTRDSALLFLQASAVLIALIGVLDIIGWVFHISLLVQIRSQYSSMKFNSGLSYVTTGAALFALLRGKRRVAAGFAVASMILPFLTAFEYLSGGDFGIDHIFITPFILDKAKYLGRMAPNTAAGILLADIALIGYTLSLHARRHGGLWLALIGSVTAALGIVPLVGYMGGLESAHTWGDFSGMALNTAFCTLLMGLNLIAYAWTQSPEDPAWLPVPIAIGFLVIALSIWMAVTSYEDLRFEQSLQQEADYIAGRGNDRLVAFYAAIDRISDRWVTAKGMPRDLWEPDVGNYLKAYPFLKAVEWVDKDMRLQWVVPAEGNQQLIGVKMNSEGSRAETARAAMESRKSKVSDSVTLLQGGQGFLYMSPLFIGDQFNGFIVAVFDLKDIVERILSRDKAGPYYVTVTQGETSIFSNQPADFEFSERWHKTAMMHNGNGPWIITVDATPELLKHKRSPLPNLVLITGLVTSFFATFSVLLALRSRRNANALRDNQERLHQIIDAYGLMTGHDFDAQSFMDVVAQRMQTLTNATGAVIEMIEGDEMVYKATSGSLDPFVAFRMKRAGSLSGLCIDSNKMVFSDDTSRDPRVNAEACRKVGASSMVIVPLAQRGEIVGILKVVSTRTHAFGEEDAQSLQLMAGMLGGALGQQLEMDRRLKLEEQLRYMAQYDELTGLPNRALFKDRLTHALLNHKRSGKILAVMYMDIDKFKQINDTHGHADGDALLKLFAERISGVLRKGDTLARLGGDEFTLIADNMDSTASAEAIAHKIFAAMKEPFALPNVTLQVGVSVGIATTAKKDTTYDELLARADEALYEVKRAGRNSFRVGHIG